MSSNAPAIFITSGRNTIIHKLRKRDLLIINGRDNPPVIVTHKTIAIYKGEVPQTKYDARKLDMELVDTSQSAVFGDERTLLFIQALDGKEYKLDYTKIGTNRFLTVHQESFL